jgi:hypothetical protein
MSRRFGGILRVQGAKGSSEMLDVFIEFQIEAPRSKLRGMFCLTAELRSTVRNRTNLYTLANPAASCGECARLIGSTQALCRVFRDLFI